MGDKNRWVEIEGSFYPVADVDDSIVTPHKKIGYYPDMTTGAFGRLKTYWKGKGVISSRQKNLDEPILKILKRSKNGRERYLSECFRNKVP